MTLTSVDAANSEGGCDGSMLGRGVGKVDIADSGGVGKATSGMLRNDETALAGMNERRCNVVPKDEGSSDGKVLGIAAGGKTLEGTAVAVGRRLSR